MSQEPLYGAETRKAIENFPISGEPVPASVIHWLARIKGAAAAVNGELGLLRATQARRIEKAAAAVAAGKYDDQFPIDVFQTGSGTSSNMNVNEVLATLAGEGIHPNDHVNLLRRSISRRSRRRPASCFRRSPHSSAHLPPRRRASTRSSRPAGRI
jgi:fumarate hydratase, class II